LFLAHTKWKRTVNSRCQRRWRLLSVADIVNGYLSVFVHVLVHVHGPRFVNANVNVDEYVNENAYVYVNENVKRKE